MRASKAPRPSGRRPFLRCAVFAEPAPEPRRFLYVPRASNLLREREHHIQLLEDELAPDQAVARQHDRRTRQTLDLHAEQTRQLEEHNPLGAATRERIGKLRLSASPKFRTNSRPSKPRPLRWLWLRAKSRRAGGGKPQARPNGRSTSKRGLSAQLANKCAELAEAVRLLDQRRGHRGRAHALGAATANTASRARSAAPDDSRIALVEARPRSRARSAGEG